MIYLCSVYSLNAKTDSDKDKKIREERYLRVMEKTNELLKGGLCVFSPIVHCHPMSNIYGLPKDFSFWEKLDKAYINACDVVWVLMMKGWEDSVGITAEIEYAKSIGKTVIYIDDI